MNRNRLALALALFLAFSPSAARAYLIFDLGSSWNWMQPLDGVDPATLYPAFNDPTQGWMANGPNFAAHYAAGAPAAYQFSGAQEGGTAGYAYGGVDGLPNPTELPIPPEGRRYTAYFRKEIMLPETRYYLGKIDGLFDDGAVVYLDGVERGRFNLPDAAADTYFQLAASSNSEFAQTFLELNGGVPFVLTAGSHTFAVSVHNVLPVSADLGFDLNFHAIPDAPVPEPSGAALALVALAGAAGAGLALWRRRRRTSILLSP